MSGKRKSGAAKDRRLTPRSSTSVSNNSICSSNPRPAIDYILSHSGTDRRPYLEVKILGRPVKGLLDSGCSNTCMGSSGLQILQDLGFQFTPATSLTCKVANNQECKILGKCSVPIQISDKIFLTDILIVPDLSHTLILGIDFWVNAGIVPNLKQNKWSFEKTEKQLSVASVISKHILSDEQRRQLEKLTQHYFELMGDKLGRTNLIEHKIIVDSQPIKSRYYPVSPAIQERINEELKYMIENDIVEPSNSSWSSPVLLVPKPNNKWRFCVDYRKLNRVTKKDAYPLPYISTILDKLRNAQYLSSLDIKSAYWQVPVAQESREYTAFTIPNRGLFQFKVLPFGLSNSPATFQRLIDKVIGSDLEKYCLVYLDDIIIVTDNFDLHLQVLDEVFKRLSAAGLTVSKEKCQFCRESLKYLGYVVDRQGLHVDPDKVSAIMNLPIPQNVKQVRQVIGTISWYRKFVPKFSDVIAPLCALLRKNKTFTWNSDCDKAFHNIKQCLVSAPILSCPDFRKPFFVQTDASGHGIGAVLSQQHEDGEHVICYISRSLSRCEKNYSTTELECLAVLWAVEKWKCYLDGYQFFVVTDHASLKWLDNLKDPTGRLGRWAVRLQQFDYEVIHRKGKDHVVPDLLSRAVPNIEVIETPTICDTWYNRMLRKVREDPLTFPDWRVENSTLLKHTRCDYPELAQESSRWKIVVPKEDRSKLLHENHDTVTSGHVGIYKTYERLKSKYYWPKMKADVTRYIHRCQVCIAHKPINHTPSGLMGSRPTITKPWQMIAVDVVGPLPRSSSGYVYILVVSDYFSKFPLLFPLRTASSKSIATLIEENVFLLFGTPEFLICDNGTQFRSHIFTSLCESYGTKILFTSPYHPQANPVERVNRNLKIMLSSYVQDNHRSWDKVLVKIACALRTSKHEVLGQTPFFVNFGREHCVSGTAYKHPIQDEAMPLDRKTGFEKVFEDVQERIKMAHQKSKARYDLRRRPVQFSVGDRVWKRNYVLSNALQGFNAKLAPKYVGPFVIKKKISPLTYELTDNSDRSLGIWHVKDLKVDSASEDHPSTSDN